MGILDTFKRKSTTGAAKKAATPKKAVAKQAVEKTTKPAGDKSLSVSGILLRPAYTEKSLRLQAENKYVFVVALTANKHQVRMAIKDTYGIEPVAVRMIRIQPQTMYRWGKAMGMHKGMKKAIVSMPAGSTLPISTK